MNPAELFRAVYANPGDDGAKQVLADLLIEQGDPRGEFIALQMQARRTRKAELKLERLLERHRSAFLGPLARVVLTSGQVWERGFLVGCRAALDGSLAEEPSWATVRALEIVQQEGDSPVDVLGPCFTSLQQVVGLPRLVVIPLFDGPVSRPWWTVAVSGPGAPETWAPEELDALRKARALPALRHLTLSLWRFGVDELEWLWTAPVFGRLRVLELSLHRVATHLATLRDRLLLLDDVPDTLVLKGRQLEVRLKPAAQWGVLHLHVRAPLVEPVLHDAEALLQSFPQGALTRFDFTSEFVPQRDALARLKALVKRFPRLAPVSWPGTSR